MRKILTILFILITITSALSADPEFIFSMNNEYSYDTNIFSNPLPQYEAPNSAGHCPWLEWKAENPFIKKHSLGDNFTIDLFFQDEDRVGISTYVSVKNPLSATTYTPTPEDKEQGFKGNWEYIESDATDKQKIAAFLGIGPIFMARLGIVDLGAAIRVSIGAYGDKDEKIILGIQAEPFIHFNITNKSFINLKFTYDAHLMRFIHSDTKIFDQDYQMISLAPSLGIGIKF